MQASRTDRRHLSEAPMSPRRHKVPSGMTLGHTLATWGGLAVALVGVFYGVRGWWPETVGCGALVLVCILAAVGDYGVRAMTHSKGSVLAAGRVEA